MENEIFLIGLNHRTAELHIREQFSLSSYCDSDTWPIKNDQVIYESFILSTCNRVEILAIGNKDVENLIIDSWASAKGSTSSELRPYVYIYKGIDAIKHLFSVASSLDSMVLGEPQILGQLKKAYRKAVELQKTGSILNRLLHKAFSVAKRVRTETSIASSAVSISYAAVELAKRIFGEMHSHSALLIGAGEMAELAALHLLQNGIQKIYVANRTFSKGRELALAFNGIAVPFEKMTSYLGESDIIISSTGSQEPIIHAKDIESILSIRKNRPMFFIDIAVPRDIDPDVNTFDNVYLYDIDDLKEVIEENMNNRQEEATKAEKIVDEEVAFFNDWLRNLELQPTILSLIQRTERIAHEELDHTLKHLPNLDESQKEALERMMIALTHKLNHSPLMFLKGSHMRKNKNNAERISLIRQVFDLDRQ
ncbi:MAG: glutamyl-tRNA reductase [Desulfovibrio sp.]|nr:glutamyl-tRNA reductase [Desulfovibrio sp.]